MLNDHGIISALSMILGYDYHTYQTAIQEVRNAIELDPTIVHFANLRVLYETKLWYEYERQGRLLDVPPEFRMLWGYQAFTHPHFHSGFTDCLPLMLECEDILRENIGSSYYIRSIEAIKNRRKSAYNDNLLKIGETMKELLKS